jgi:hypothetical protein
MVSWLWIHSELLFTRIIMAPSSSPGLLLMLSLAFAAIVVVHCQETGPGGAVITNQVHIFFVLKLCNLGLLSRNKFGNYSGQMQHN